MTIQLLVFLSTIEERVGLTFEDKALLKSEADWGLKVAPEMADHFYAYLGRDAEMSAILIFHAEDGGGKIHQLRETFIKWFHEMFTGIDDWGWKYAERRWKIGLTHARIGIEPQHVVPAMATVIYQVGKRLRTDDKSDALKYALNRICMIDLAFIQQAYVEVSSAASRN